VNSDANRVLRSGWRVFLVIALLVSVALDIANPGVDLRSGTRFNFGRGGSATLGWLTVVIIFISPAYLLRAIGIAPINRWVAAFLCFVGVFVWVGLHTSTESNSRSHFNYTMWGCVILAWRLLTIPRIAASEDKGIKLSEPDKVGEVDGLSITKIETQTDSMDGRSEKYTPEAS